MRRRLQNKIAESKTALPLTLLFSTVVWVLAGLFQEGWWLQWGLFLLSVYLVALLNNINSLIRIYSRMVSCSFIALTCSAPFLFPSLADSIVQVCFIGFLLFLFMTYQDKTASGFTYYAFLCMGIASIFFVRMLLMLPLLWLLMVTQLNSLSWRTWMASVLGILTPYWFGCCLLVWLGNFTMLTHHASMLLDWSVPPDAHWTLGQTVSLLLVTTLAIVGNIHFFRNKGVEKIRIRLFYGFLFWIDAAMLIFAFFQPQHTNLMLRLMCIATAPAIAHYITLTSTRITNLSFFVMIAVTLIITSYNLWMY